MINRIRDIRLQKGLTLADVAAACTPPTTAQTIGRLETGTRNLSLVWMNRIAAALQVEPELLLRSEGTTTPPRVVAVLAERGPEPLRNEREAVLPTALTADATWIVLEVEGAYGEFRAGDQIWLHQHGTDAAATLLNRDVLVPTADGKFAFGRLSGATDGSVTLLPPLSGRGPVAVEQPAWLAVAEVLVRKL